MFRETTLFEVASQFGRETMGFGPPPLLGGTKLCIPRGCLVARAAGPALSGGVIQRFAEAVDSVGLEAAAVWTACSERRAAR